MKPANLILAATAGAAAWLIWKTRQVAAPTWGGLTESQWQKMGRLDLTSDYSEAPLIASATPQNLSLSLAVDYSDPSTQNWFKNYNV